MPDTICRSIIKGRNSHTPEEKVNGQHNKTKDKRDMVSEFKASYGLPEILANLSIFVRKLSCHWNIQATGIAPLSLASLAPLWKITNLIIANLSIEGKRII